jgi:hypothetical protein
MCHFALLHSHINGCELFQKRMLLLQGSALKSLVETKVRAWAFEKVCSAGANPSEKKAPVSSRSKSASNLPCIGHKATG